MKLHFRPFLILCLVLPVLVFSLQALSAQDSPAGDCPQGQGFWKNHASAWTVTDLTLGSQSYTQAELLVILGTPPAGDASLILARQLIAVKLNVANGVDASAINATIIEADGLLAKYPGKLPYNVNPASEDGQKMVIEGSTFDAYNQGLLSAVCSQEETPEATETPESTATPEVTATPESTSIPEATPESTQTSNVQITIVIEGPVEAINVNVITIYGINVELNPNDPILTVIQIGDVVHIEGNFKGGTGTTVVIVAVTIVIVNVEVVENGGQVWRDQGNCGNPPPPWAPAKGWHKRCDQQQGGGEGDDEGNGKGKGKKHHDD